MRAIDGNNSGSLTSLHHQPRVASQSRLKNRALFKSPQPALVANAADIDGVRSCSRGHRCSSPSRSPTRPYRKPQGSAYAHTRAARRAQHARPSCAKPSLIALEHSDDRNILPQPSLHERHNAEGYVRRMTELTLGCGGLLPALEDEWEGSSMSASQIRLVMARL